MRAEVGVSHAIMPYMVGMKRLVDEPVSVHELLGPGMEEVHIPLVAQMLLITGALDDFCEVDNAYQQGYEKKCNNHPVSADDRLTLAQARPVRVSRIAVIHSLP